MAMGNWAAERNPEFILSLGDNFYPDGVASVNDTQWDTKWRQVSVFLLVKQKSKSISRNSYQFNAGHFPVLKTNTVTESDHTAFHFVLFIMSIILVAVCMLDRYVITFGLRGKYDMDGHYSRFAA